MRYGFVVDHRKCIGCHACTVACKAEHDVPIGSFRTWVKYIEKGQYPSSRRFFSVLRCNHCDKAPCITICPVTALFRRDNGIVDFDGDRCIGCKACMQACPYDALYINPNTNTAEKCNFCAHRIETRREPACVIVCPVQAIVSGDLDDPSTNISQLIAAEKTLVRKPEAGTEPKLHYIEVDESSLVPTDQTHAKGYLWAELHLDPLLEDEQSMAEAEARARTTYDVSHDRPWGWKVSAYLWTKSVSAGAFLVASLGIGLGFARTDWLFGSVAPQISLVFLAATLALLVVDLKRPERFLRVLLWPQWRSWLVIGGYILFGYGFLLAAWIGAQLLDLREMYTPLLLLGGISAALAAVYTAFLFRQARGRVFWHSQLAPLHLFVQAMVAGSAILILFAVFDSAVTGLPLRSAGFEFLYYEFLGAIIAHGVLAAGEVFTPEESADKRRAARLITKGIYKNFFWGGVIAAGVVLPTVALATAAAQTPVIAALISLLALGGLALWEHIWVQAGQAVPLS